MALLSLEESIIAQNRTGLIIYLVILLLSHLCFGFLSAKPRFNKYVSIALYAVFSVFCIVLAKFWHDFSLLFIAVFLALIITYVIASAGNPFKAAFSITSYLIFFSIFFGISFMLLFIQGPYAMAIRWTIFSLIFVGFELSLYLYLLPKFKKVETNNDIGWVLFTIGNFLYLIIIFLQVFYPFQLSQENVGGIVLFVLTVVFYIFVYVMILHTFDTSILYDQEKVKSQHLQEIAVIDKLTSLYNKNYLSTYSEEINESKIENVLITIMDINKFKAINDKYGHMKGDEVLKDVALVIKETFSKDCYKCFRFGGDEFVVISINVDENEMSLLIKEMKAKLKEQLDISISAGYQYVDYKDIDPIETAIKNADKSMYQDKFNR